MPELSTFSARIAELLADLPHIDPERGLVLRMLDFTAEAKAHWIASYNAIKSELRSSGDFASIRNSASKAADNIARLAAMLHVFDDNARDPISVQSVEAASRIVHWHTYSTRALLAPFTLRGLVAELGDRGLQVDYHTMWTFVHAEGLSHKKRR